MARFSLPNFGPPKLRKIHEAIAAKINQIIPLPGIGIDVDQKPDGLQISARAQVSPDKGKTGATIGGGSSSGTPVDIYGSLNGAPAVFHLLQTSAPAPIP